MTASSGQVLKVPPTSPWLRKLFTVSQVPCFEALFRTYILESHLSQILGNSSANPYLHKTTESIRAAFWFWVHGF